MDKEYEQHRKDKPFFRDEKGVQFVPAFFRLAMPETEAEANKDLETLQACQPPPPKFELKDIPKHLWDEHGNRSMIVRWVREIVRLNK